MKRITKKVVIWVIIIAILFCLSIFSEYSDFPKRDINTEYLYFGKTEQDNNVQNGKEEIEWLVLCKKEDKMLLLSKYALLYEPFDNMSYNALWQNCSLRSFLNTDFYNSVFSDKEKALIIPTPFTYKSYICDTHKTFEQTVCDNVFLLSLSEIENFISENSRACKPTKYLKMNGNLQTKNGYCCWWYKEEQLLPPIVFCINNPAIYFDGSICKTDLSKNESMGVRPAVWIYNNRQ